MPFFYTKLFRIAKKKNQLKNASMITVRMIKQLIQSSVPSDNEPVSFVASPLESSCSQPLKFVMS